MPRMWNDNFVGARHEWGPQERIPSQHGWRFAMLHGNYCYPNHDVVGYQWQADFQRLVREICDRIAHRCRIGFRS